MRRLKVNADWITTRCATDRAGIGISRCPCWLMQCCPRCERVEKKLPTRTCGSAYPNCAICSPRCYGAGGTALNTCCIGPSGEDDINSAPCAATIESAHRLCRASIYNCSTRLALRKSRGFVARILISTISANERCPIHQCIIDRLWRLIGEDYAPPSITKFDRCRYQMFA